MKNQIGLRQRILKANNKAEIDVLLQEGKGYSMASYLTEYRWTLAAKRRLESLEKGQSEARQTAKIEAKKAIKKA